MHTPVSLLGPRRTAVTRLMGLILLAALALAGCQSEEEFSSQGTAAVPVDLGTAPVSYDEGSVGSQTSSYYKVAVSEGVTYTITLSSLADDADLIVFSDAAFSTVFCVSVKNGTESEVCSKLVEVGSGITTLYIQVKPHTNTGTTYILSVS